MPFYPLSVYNCPNGHEPFYSRAAFGAVTWRCPDCGAVGEYQRCDGEGFTWLRPARPVNAFAAALLLSLLLPISTHATEPACRVNVSTCKAAECAYLPGIGPSKGAAIEAAHPMTEAELDAVPGIGGKTLEKLRPFVTYQGETTCTSKQVAPKLEAAGGKDGAQ